MIKHLSPLLVAIGLLVSCNAPQPGERTVSSFQFAEFDIAKLQKGYSEGEYTIEQVVQSYLDRIEAIDNAGPQLNSIIVINPDALEIARALDAEMKEGKLRGPLHGVPIVLKDNIDTHDKMETTAGSRALLGSHPLKDSEVARKLREAGAVIIAKANLSEWANFRGRMSSSGWSGVGGQTRNPYDITRNPCGSSSGSGVAVSANLTMLAIGTETNGSIVCPSNNNGIVGIKPTVGLVSRSGIIPISFTQDTAGPMARTVTDAVLCLNAIVSVDSTDSKTLAGDRKIYDDYSQFLKADGLKGKRIGWWKGPMGRNHKLDEVMEEAVLFMKSQGAEIFEVETIESSEVGSLSLEVMIFEYKDGLNKYFASLGPDAKIKSLEDLIAFNKADPIELKHYNQVWLERAQEKAGLDSDEYKEILEKMLRGSREEGIDRVMNEQDLDAIIAPTGGPAWKTDWTNGDSGHVSSSSPAAHAGYPNITLPMGVIEGLPVGISFFGRAWSEAKLIEMAFAFEQGTNHRIEPRFLESNYKE
ncbi:MAG: amidase [Cytophagales bacterium]